VKIKALDHRRRDDRIAASLDAKLRQIAGRLFTADTFQSALE